MPGQTVTQRLNEEPEPVPVPTQTFLGIDVGSVSTNLVLLNTEAELIQGIYLATRGEPLAAIEEGLSRIREQYSDRLEILGVGVVREVNEDDEKKLRNQLHTLVDQADIPKLRQLLRLMRSMT